jgi:hypothetical protein
MNELVIIILRLFVTFLEQVITVLEGHQTNAPSPGTVQYTPLASTVAATSRPATPQNQPTPRTCPSTWHVVRQDRRIRPYCSICGARRGDTPSPHRRYY